MNDISKNVLSEELKFFEKKREEFLKNYKDQFVLIKGNQFLGTFTTEAEAYQAGVTKYGNEPFLIKKVLEKEQTTDVPALTIGVINAGL